LRINIDYPSGSFEVDVRTKERLGPLVQKLKILDHVKIAIHGYTDNIGPAEANQELSQKRANRMRDWLVSLGIASDRLTPVGKGETNFVASNETATGRALNRRIEFIFSY
jgi:OOP family OmpA-OmpF porin